MAKEWAKKFYKSKAWRQCRESYITSPQVAGLCENCKEPGYILHHITPLTPENINDVDIALSWDNLEFLCLTCHNTHHPKNGPGRGAIGEDLRFDDEGNIWPT